MGMFGGFLGREKKPHPSAEFHNLVISNELKKVAIMLYRGTSVDILDKNRNSPLLLACLEGHDEMVLLLLQHGASIDIRPKVIELLLRFSLRFVY